LPPRGLAPPLHRLPPILDNAPQTPTSSCSKGSRGLSVQPRVLGIFTETTVSPGPSLRQRPSRYAIRAGRNFALIPRFRGRRLSLHLGQTKPRRRRLIATIDLLAQCSRSHVHYGRSVVTGSSSEEPTSHGITLSRHGVLERRIRGGLPRYEPVRANQLPDKEFRLNLSYRCYVAGRTLPWMFSPACRHADGTISSSYV
jgi:hypothetical protein